MTPERAARAFWLLVAAHLVVWTVARVLAEPNAPLDVVEMAYLGHEWQLGYANHPPLAAWVTEAALVLAGGSVWAVHLVAQLAMVTCLWAAWRLGREMVTPGAALLGAALLECCLYYHFTTTEVNNNVALAPFWALAVLFFYRALDTGAARYWLATGASIGVGFLAKYSMAVLVVVMVGFMLAHPIARGRWSMSGASLAVIAALVVVAPHLIWAVQQHFPGVRWALERTQAGEDPGSRLVNVLIFARDQLPALLPMLAVLLPLTGVRWRLRPLDSAGRFKRAFLLAMGLGPFAAQAALALVLDLRLRSMYGSQLWTFTGVLLLFSLALRPEPLRWRAAAAGCAAVGVLMIAAAVFYDAAWPYVRGKPMSVHFPGREAAAQIDAIWRAREDRPLTIVGGEWWLAANVALYHRPRLRVYGGGPYAGHAIPSAEDNPWTSDGALARDGGILLWNPERQEPGIAAILCRRFPTLELLDPLVLHWQTGAPVPPLRIAMAIVPPGSDAPASRPHSATAAPCTEVFRRQRSEAVSPQSPSGRPASPSAHARLAPALRTRWGALSSPIGFPEGIPGAARGVAMSYDRWPRSVHCTAGPGRCRSNLQP